MKKKLRLAVLMAMVMTMLVPLNAAVNDTFVIDNLKYEVTSEGGESGNCVKVVGFDSNPTNLIQLEIPESVTNSETTYGYCIFSEINIPKNVTDIGSCAFEGNGYLNKITVNREAPPTSDYAFYNLNLNNISLYFEGEALAENYNTGDWGSMQHKYDSSYTEDGMTFSLPETLPENPEANMPEATLSSYTGEETTLDIPATIRAHGYDFAVTSVKAEALSGITEIKINSATPLTIIGSFTGSDEVTVRYPLGAREAYENSDWGGCNLRPYDSATGTEAHVATVEVGGQVEGSVIVKIGGEVKGTVSKGESKVFDVNGDIVISPAEGVEIASITVKDSNGQEKRWEVSGDDRTISQAVVTSDVTARITLNKMKLITVSPSSGGKIYVDDNDVTGTSFYVKTGTQLNVKAIANSGYHFSCLKINDDERMESTVDGYVVNEDITLTAEFALDWFVSDNLKYQVLENETNEVAVISKVGSVAALTIPASVTSPDDEQMNYAVTQIADNAFANDLEITSIDIPSSITTIGGNAFKGCTSLEKFKIRKAIAATPSASATGAEAHTVADGVVVPVVGENALEDIVGIASLYVPEGWKDAYKADLVWGRFYKIKEYRDDENETVLAELTLTTSAGGTLTVGTVTSENDTQTVKVAEGSNVTVTVTPAEGYILSSLFYGGQDVTTQVVDGSLALISLEGENSLTAEFCIETGIGGVYDMDKTVYVSDGRIVVDGVAAGEVVIVCDASGRVLSCKVTNGEPIEIGMSAGKVYIVRIGKQTIKLTM